MPNTDLITEMDMALGDMSSICHPLTTMYVGGKKVTIDAPAEVTLTTKQVAAWYDTFSKALKAIEAQ